MRDYRFRIWSLCKITKLCIRWNVRCWYIDGLISFAKALEILWFAPSHRLYNPHRRVLKNGRDSRRSHESKMHYNPESTADETSPYLYSDQGPLVLTINVKHSMDK